MHVATRVVEENAADDPLQIPRHCSWQEMKDMTRHMGGEHCLKAIVFPLPDGSQGGHCTVKGKTQALQVYESFVERGWTTEAGKYNVTVTLGVLKKPDGVKVVRGPETSRVQSASGLAHPYQQVGHISRQIVSPVSPTYSAMPPLAHSVAAPYVPSSTHACQVYPAVGATAVTPPLYPSPRPSYSFPPPPTHPPCPSMPSPPIPSTSYGPRSVPSPSGSPTPSSPTRSEPPVCCEVVVSGLPSSLSEQSLREVLHRYGSVVYVEIPDREGRTRSTATVRARYRHSHDAARAARKLDGADVAGRKVRATLADGEKTPPASPTATRRPPRKSSSAKKRKSPSPAQQGTARSTSEPTPSGGRRPLIVNGAMSPERKTRRGGSDESDEDSTDESSDSFSDAGGESHPQLHPLRQT